VWRVLVCRKIEQIELSVFGLVPRHAHERIVPLRIDARWSPATLARPQCEVPQCLNCAKGVSVRLNAVTHSFNFPPTPWARRHRLICGIPLYKILYI
jgi:hypothetical protein